MDIKSIKGKYLIGVITIALLLLVTLFVFIPNDSKSEETVEKTTEEVNETFELENKSYKVGTNISQPENITNSTNPFINGSFFQNETNISE